MQTTCLIGRRCKCSNVFSWAILIDRGLELLCFVRMSDSSIHFQLCPWLTRSRKAECWSIESAVSRKTKCRFTVGVFDSEGPPVPIPNTEVKLVCAYNTWLEAARDDWSMPTQNPETGERKQLQKCNCFLYLFLRFSIDNGKKVW